MAAPTVGRRPDAAPAPDGRSDRRPGTAWGHWDSAVTSYYLILGATLLLVTIGVVMVLSSSSVRSLTESDGASPYGIFASHAQYALLGVPLMLVLSRFPVRFWKRMAWPLLGVALVLQLLVFTGLGREVNGNLAWIEPLPGQRFQPAEAAKVALALWLGVVLARKRHLLGDWRHLIPPMLGVVAVVGLVLAGHDLGTGLVVIALAAGAFFVAGLPLRWFGLAAVLAAGVVAYLANTENRVARILSFFSPDCDVLGACYQTTRGLYGLGSGGLLGLGLGESREKWAYLPEAHNDFIFAILGEELGLLGTLLVVALFGVLAVAVARVVRRHPEPFVQIAAGGIGVWILGQAVVNMAVVVGLLPVVGVPLPLVSAGGSALVVTLGALGILMAFARSEPGASEALSARAGSVRRSLAVIGRTRSARD